MTTVHQCQEYLNYHPYPFIAPHTELIQSYKERRIYSLLRTFSLPLKNNLLRLGIRNNNLCEKCSGTFVENEYHFFLDVQFTLSIGKCICKKDSE